ncbi:MAG: HEAT repeat domain-containing protein [Pirellulales bacterium]|nr:HEAT repeat domain-containing protein [Pirellulales bacterium]
MARTEELPKFVEQMPDSDRRGMLTENIDQQKIEAAVTAIYEGGPANIQGLIDMLGEPGTPEDVKPHYALHCVLNRALIAHDEPARRAFCETLAANLGRDLSNAKKAYLCQELQWAGHAEVAPALGQLLLDEDLVEPAAMALVAIREGALAPLRAALPKADGKCRLNIIHGLAALGDVESAAAFQDALEDDDREVRLAAGAGLAKIGAGNAVDAMLKAADAKPGWERIQATKHCLVLAEKLLADGPKDLAIKIYQHLRATRTDPSEQYVRELADHALGAA